MFVRLRLSDFNKCICSAWLDSLIQFIWLFRSFSAGTSVCATIHYPINAFASAFKGNIADFCQRVADLGSTYKWVELLQLLHVDSFNGGNRSLYSGAVNICRLPIDATSVVDLCTPSHYAAKGSAPKAVFEQLVELVHSNLRKMRKKRPFMTLVPVLDSVTINSSW